jgi:hypothetical protein
VDQQQNSRTIRHKMFRDAARGRLYLRIEALAARLWIWTIPGRHFVAICRTFSGSTATRL